LQGHEHWLVLLLRVEFPGHRVQAWALKSNILLGEAQLKQVEVPDFINGLSSGQTDKGPI
jgi:hypothetical protein